MIASPIRSDHALGSHQEDHGSDRPRRHAARPRRRRSPHRPTPPKSLPPASSEPSRTASSSGFSASISHRQTAAPSSSLRKARFFAQSPTISARPSLDLDVPGVTDIPSIFTRDKPDPSDGRVTPDLATAKLPFSDSVPTGTDFDMMANLPVVDPARTQAQAQPTRAEQESRPGPGTNTWPRAASAARRSRPGGSAGCAGSPDHTAAAAQTPAPASAPAAPHALPDSPPPPPPASSTVLCCRPGCR